MKVKDLFAINPEAEIYVYTDNFGDAKPVVDALCDYPYKNATRVSILFTKNATAVYLRSESCGLVTTIIEDLPFKPTKTVEDKEKDKSNAIVAGPSPYVVKFEQFDNLKSTIKQHLDDEKNYCFSIDTTSSKDSGFVETKSDEIVLMYAIVENCIEKNIIADNLNTNEGDIIRVTHSILMEDNNVDSCPVIVKNLTNGLEIKEKSMDVILQALKSYKLKRID